MSYDCNSIDLRDRFRCKSPPEGTAYGGKSQSITEERIDGGRPFDWGRTSADYAKYRDIYPELFYRKLVDRGLCVKGQTVLDIGTGTGVLPRNLYRYGAAWVGIDSAGEQICVMHSCMDQNGRYSKSVRNPTEADLLSMFADVNSDVILYGHDHTPNVCRGEKLYINVGSLGCPCMERNLARAGVLTVENGEPTISLLAVRYDVDAVIR